ncbi:MAG: type II secretion system F family protein [Alphaproteobacteria bacterium]|nr:type II secretion system F family protein [Alphaproteobacteria bacterium]
MREILLDIFTAFITFVVYLWIKPHADIWINKLLSSLRVVARMKKTGVQASAVDANFNEEDENIGLSKKGPMFGNNALFNLIGERYPEFIDDMKALLIRAGMRQDSDLEKFMTSKATSCCALVMILFLVLGTNDFDIPIYAVIAISLLGGVYGGNKLSDMNMEMLAAQRKEAIEGGVPDLIDLLVICTESGLDLNNSIRRIAREMRASNPILAEELSLTSIELEMIPDHHVVFSNLEQRTDCLEIRTIASTLSQAIDYGSSLSASLKELATEARQKKMLLVEEKAAKAPTLLTLPMMFFIMPCLFIVMLGPVIIQMIASFNK